MRALVVGATGGIGSALVAHLEADAGIKHVASWSRAGEAMASARRSVSRVELTDEATIAKAAGDLGEIDLVIIATGLLHEPDAGIQPEKTWRAFDIDTMRRVFDINTFGPALVAKHVLPHLPRDRRAVFAVLSARVGSISDNRLGGWYSYRASKAALNQIIRCLSIELTPKRPLAICVGLHPGTVHTDLSQPFRGNSADGGVFTPERSAGHLLDVINGLTPSHSGRVFDWTGAEVPA